MTAQARRLAEIRLGLGAADGYSGDDLTNPGKAARNGEVPYLRPDEAGPASRPLELRVHGVGGAPPADNLETPATLQVAGDSSAGFYRPWHPGGTPHQDEPRREAYCWGKLNVGSWTRALWLMLVAFMIVNVAYFALPIRSGTAPSRVLHYLCRAVLRWIALAITLAFVGTTVTVLADITAYQGGSCPDDAGDACTDALPSWMGSFGSLAVGPRVAIALLAVLGVVFVLWWLSVRTATDYEAWKVAGADGEQKRSPALLSGARFWRGERTVARQRNCHVIAAAAQVAFLAAMPESAESAARVVVLALAGALGVTAFVLLGSWWADREHANNNDDVEVSDRAVFVVAVGAVALAVGTTVSRFWWRPEQQEHALPGNHPLQSWIVVGLFALLVILLLLVAAQRPWRRSDGGRADVMARGFAPWLLATLAAVVASVFGAAFTLTIANLLDKSPRYCPRDGICGPKVLYLPPTVYAGGIGMIGIVIFGVMIGIGVALRRRKYARTYRRSGVDGVLAHYRDRMTGSGGDGTDDDARYDAAVSAVAKTWATSKLTDLAGAILFWIAVPAAGAIGWFLVDVFAFGKPLFRWSIGLATFGGTLGVLAVGYFLLQLRSALTSASSRKRFGFIWDVGTFFPRSSAPFGPPCYAERSVPEIVTRIRRVVGDRVRGDDDPAEAVQQAERVGGSDTPTEAHSGVLLVGYSQGTPISVAVLAQLPAEVADRVALLLLAAPVRRLYGRTFPEYFGAAQLPLVQQMLAGTDGRTRWRTLVRRSDYIGGWVLAPPTPDGPDRFVFDPPVLWTAADPSPPPTHKHSDWFPDPQTRPHADELAAMITGADRVSGDSTDQRDDPNQYAHLPVIKV